MINTKKAPSKYWETKIIEWENSMSGSQKRVPWIERLAARFREPLKIRSAKCMELILPFVTGKTVLELGCGSGYFGVELAKKGNLARYQGIDISPMAVERAQDLAKREGLADKMMFRCNDAADLELPAADITIGLGFLDYLSPEELKTLFKKIKSRYFLFTFSEKKVTLLQYIHILYLITQKCDKHFYYSKSEMGSFLGDKIWSVRYYNDKRLSFGCILHNLPQ